MCVDFLEGQKTFTKFTKLLLLQQVTKMCNFVTESGENISESLIINIVFVFCL